MLPSLRRLSLVGMSGVPWKDIHLNDLLSLEIEGFDAANFYPIIDACPNLEQIRLRGYTSISPEYSTLSRRICMPSLRTLSLSLPASFCEQVIRCLDRAIYFPSIRHGLLSFSPHTVLASAK
ncbi:hypothetical protein BD410DRAFT_794380 [Rickenella mellea]|uniref:F-box domain-containing protein n=1 Tax=Rickenella mellea TaxID=50990 RepID=A0A4Y7PS89_9AGAM|nr:hypothetical protein BD410DRAFT_794380 [Rickenella mellea]